MFSFRARRPLASVSLRRALQGPPPRFGGRRGSPPASSLPAPASLAALAPSGRALRYASGCGRYAPLGERSRPAAASSFGPPRYARPPALGRARVRRFSSRFARSCVSPRLAARGSALRSGSLRSPSLSVAPLRSPRHASSRPRVPLAAPALCAPCGVCPRALRLRPPSAAWRPLPRCAWHLRALS